jgi:hypothetical protein
VFCSVDVLKVLSEEELVERALQEAMEVTSPLLIWLLLSLCWEPVNGILIPVLAGGLGHWSSCIT